MKNVFFLSLLFYSTVTFAQTNSHNFFCGLNLTSVTNIDFTTAVQKYKTNSQFKNPKAGFNIGYKYTQKIFNQFSFSAGLEYKKINVKEFTRPDYNYYNLYNNLAPSSPVYETIKLSRFQIPLQINYDIVAKKKKLFYLTAGTSFIIVNNINRNAVYTIPNTTGDMTAVFKGNQKIKFGNDKNVGTNLLLGIGKDFHINKMNFFSEFIFTNDISKNKFLTLKNIEDDAYFYGKFKSIELKVGYRF